MRHLLPNLYIRLKLFFLLPTAEEPQFGLDQPPKWDETQRESVNRSLLKEFEAENTHEDTTDDASAINRNQKLSKVCDFFQILKLQW